jgi:hypothetical protein
MFSEASAEIFVLRSRASPSCPTECVKIAREGGPSPFSTAVLISQKIDDDTDLDNVVYY